MSAEVSARPPTDRALVFNPGYRAWKLGRSRALTAPMTRIPMADDPFMDQSQEESRARLERRACQYATWIARRDDMLRLGVREYSARFDGVATVTFTCWLSTHAHEFSVLIPEHVLRFDASAPALMMEAAESLPSVVATVCERTIALDLAPHPDPLAQKRSNAAHKAWTTRRAMAARKAAPA